jgi:membrane protein implicated in regulation of membrane protease activity
VWTGIYLTLFAFGLIFTVASLFLNTGDDLPDLNLDGDASDGGGASGPSPLSLSTAMIFVTWFGATGYIARTWGGLAVPLTFLLAALIGFIGAALVYLFLAKVLWRGQTQLRPADYAVEGTIATVTSSIRAGGTGEIVYSLAGSKRVDGARSVDGSAIANGAEVSIVRYEGGLAYVAPLDWAGSGGAFLGNPIEEVAIPPARGRQLGR